MKYSFILPAYKATYFREAIDSILNQTYKEFELIIVNDASPEDLSSIIKSYNDPRIQYYVNETNIGGKDLVAQWTHSISYANGEYIILASDDDVYFPHYLEKMDMLVNKYPNVNVFRPRLQVIDAQGSITRVYGSINEIVSPLEYWYYWSEIGSSIGHVIFNRKSLIENGGFVNFPLAWGSDDATILRLGYNGICFENDILYSFRNSGENISSRKNSYKTLIGKIDAHCMLYYWLKDFMKDFQPTSNYDMFYKKECLGNLEDLFQHLTLGSINNASFFSTIRALPKLLGLEYTSMHVVLKRVIWKLRKS